MNNKAVIDLELQKNKKYCRCAQVVEELNYFQDFFLAFAMFIDNICNNYD